MTKEEYQDFVLRYKGCGACFPMYHTLSRFEKMWFTAIQKDVENLERQNKNKIADLERKLEQTEKDLTDYQFNYPKIKDLEKENAELEKENARLKLELEALDGQIPWKDIKDKSEVLGKLTKAKELLKRSYENYIYLEPIRSEIEQFLKE